MKFPFRDTPKYELVPRIRGEPAFPEIPVDYLDGTQLGISLCDEYPFSIPVDIRFGFFNEYYLFFSRFNPKNEGS